MQIGLPCHDGNRSALKKSASRNKTARDFNDSLQSRISELESRMNNSNPSDNSQPTQGTNPPPPEITPTNNNNDDPSQLTQSGASMFGHGAHRRVRAIVSGNRVNKVFNMSSIPSHNPTQVEGRIELDSHADTTCAGPEVKVVEYTGQSCTVHGFSDSLNAISDVPIINGITAYVDNETGETFILSLNNALYLGDKIQHSLLCPNQARYNGVVVDDVPIHLGNNATHSVYFPDNGLRIPLRIRGCMSYIQCHYPSEDKINNCTWIELTSNDIWDPYSEQFELEERRSIEARLGRNVSAIEAPSRSIVGHDELTRKIVSVYSAKTSYKASDIKPERLSKLWGISKEKAAKTIEATTQMGLRLGIYPLVRRFRTKQAHLRYNLLGGRYGTFYTDTFFSSVVSQQGFTCGQIYCNAAGFTFFVPLLAERDAHLSLTDFVQNVGIPSALVSDNAGAEMKKKFKNKTSEYNINVRTTEPYSLWQNWAEGEIKEIKKLVRRKMFLTGTPMPFWCYCCEFISRIMSYIARPLFSLKGRTGYEMVTGSTPDISEYCDFEWYQPVWYYDEITQFPEEKRQVGRWLGPAHRTGQALTYYIINKKANVIARSTVQPPTDIEKNDDEFRKNLDSLDKKIATKYGEAWDWKESKDSQLPLLFDNDEDVYIDDDQALDLDLLPSRQANKHNKEIEDKDLEDPEVYDAFIEGRVRIPNGNEYITGTIKRRKRDDDGNLIGQKCYA